MDDKMQGNIRLAKERLQRLRSTTTTTTHEQQQQIPPTHQQQQLPPTNQQQQPSYQVAMSPFQQHPMLPFQQLPMSSFQQHPISPFPQYPYQMPHFQQSTAPLNQVSDNTYPTDGQYAYPTSTAQQHHSLPQQLPYSNLQNPYPPAAASLEPQYQQSAMNEQQNDGYFGQSFGQPPPFSSTSANPAQENANDSNFLRSLPIIRQPAMNNQQNGGYVRQGFGPAPHQPFSLSIANPAQENANDSNFLHSLPTIRRPGSSNNQLRENQQQHRYNMRLDYDGDDDSVFYEPSNRIRPPAETSRPQRSLTPSFRHLEAPTNNRRHTVSITSSPKPYRRLMAHEHDLEKFSSLISTEKCDKILLSINDPTKHGAQAYDLCPTKALVKLILIRPSQYTATLEDDSVIGPLSELQQDFFNAFTPAPTFTISSNESATFKAFFDSCNDFSSWAADIRSIVLTGVLSSNTVLTMLLAMPNLHEIRLVPTQFSESITLQDCLNTITRIKTLFVDGRAFDNSTFYNDTITTCKWMTENQVPNRSVILYTDNMCGPKPLLSILQNDILHLSGNNVLTVISASPLYRPIHDVLRSAMNYGPTLSHSSYPEVYVSFSLTFEDNYTLNIGFSRQKKNE